MTKLKKVQIFFRHSLQFERGNSFDPIALFYSVKRKKITDELDNAGVAFKIMPYRDFDLLELNEEDLPFIRLTMDIDLVRENIDFFKKFSNPHYCRTTMKDNSLIV